MASGKPRRVAHVTYQQLPDGSGVLVNDATGEALAINATAADVWDLCDGTLTARQITRALLERYDAGEQEVQESVDALLADLVQRGVLELNDHTRDG